MYAEVCEHRLYYGHPPLIDTVALLTLDLLYHELGEVDPIRPDGN